MQLKKRRELLRILPLQDSYGRPTPDWLRDVFAGGRELRWWTQDLREMLIELRQMALEPFCRSLDEERVVKLLNSAITLVDMAQPFAQCDCPPQETDCPKCHGERWYSARDLIEAANGETS
jgi:hypothetical protein